MLFAWLVIYSWFRSNTFNLNQVYSMVTNWSAYNLAQQNEVFIFLDRLPEAVIQAVGDKDLWTGMGRPPRNYLTY